MRETNTFLFVLLGDSGKGEKKKLQISNGPLCAQILHPCIVHSGENGAEAFCALFCIWAMGMAALCISLFGQFPQLCASWYCCCAWYWCASHYCWWLQPSRGCFLTPPEKFCSCSNNSVGWVWERIALQDCKTAGGRDEHIKCNTSLRLFPVPTIDTVFHKRVAT